MSARAVQAVRAQQTATMIASGKPVSQAEADYLAQKHPEMYRAAIVAAGKRIDQYPGSQEEAQARGVSSYIPQAQKQASFDAIKQGYSESVAYQNQVRFSASKGGAKASSIAIKGSPLEMAKESQRRYEMFNAPANQPLQGTAALQPNIYGLAAQKEERLSGLSESERAEFEGWKEDLNRKAAIDVGLFMGSAITIPVVGATSALIGAGSSLAISQGAKSLGGGGWLSPGEAVYAAEFGIIFSGASKGAMAGVQAVAPRVAASSLGRAGVNSALGAGISGILSGGDPIEMGKGAAMGGLFSLAGDKIIRPLLQRAAGYKVSRVTGAEEIELTKGTENSLSSKRLTTLNMETERVPRGYGKWLSENQRYFLPEEVELGGKQTITSKGATGYEYREGLSYSASRGADPFIKAATGVSSRSSQGIADLSGSATKEIVTSSKNPGQILQQTQVTREAGGFLAPEITGARRSITAFQVKGKVDPQVYLDYLKVVPKDVSQGWLYQMGGISAVQIQKLAVSPKSQLMTVFTNVVDVQSGKVGYTSVPGFVGSTKAAAPVLKRLERSSSINVNSVAVEPSKISPSPISYVAAAPVQQQNRGLSAVVMPSLFRSPSENLSPGILSREDVGQTPGFSPLQVPFQAPRQQPGQTPVMEPAQVPKTTTSTVTGFSPSSFGSFSIPYIGGGIKVMEGGSSGFDIPRFRGVKSRKKKYPILTADEVFRL